MKVLLDDKYMTVTRRDEFLSLVWKDYTSNLTDEDFKTEAKKFIRAVETERSKRILVDMRKFEYQLSDELVEWRRENIISVYNKLGVKKFAFIAKTATVNQDDPRNTFVTRSFKSEDEGVAWLVSE